MLLKSPPITADLDDVVLGEFTSAPPVITLIPVEQPAPVSHPAPQEVAPVTIQAEEVPVLQIPQFLMNGRGAGFGLANRLASAFSRAAPEEAKVSQPIPDPQPTAEPLYPTSAPARAPAAAAAPALAAARQVSRPPPAPAQAPKAARATVTSGEPVPQPQKRLPRLESPAIRGRAFAIPPRAAIAVGAASACLIAGWIGFTAGQRHVQATGVVAAAATTSAAPAFALASPIAVAAAAAPASTAASALGSPIAPTSGALAPDSVLAAASANLPPMASLPPAIDERRVDQRPAATRTAAAPLPAPQSGTTTQQGVAQQQQDGLIALGGDSQGQAVERVVAAPSSAGAQEPKRATLLRQPTVAASSVAKADPESGIPTVRKMKYGSMGITALTATSVVVVNGKLGQLAVTKDHALPDGSIVQSVDAQSHRIWTNRGVIQLF